MKHRTPAPVRGGGPSGYAEYCLWAVGRLWAFWASLGYVPSSLEGSGPVGSGGLTSRVCVFTKGTSPSRIVPSYKSATSRCPRCRSCAWSPRSRRRTCTCSCACARRQGARHAAAQVDGRFRKVKRSRRAAAPPPRRNRPVVAHVIPLEHKRAGRRGSAWPTDRGYVSLFASVVPGVAV